MSLWGLDDDLRRWGLDDDTPEPGEAYLVEITDASGMTDYVLLCQWNAAHRLARHSVKYDGAISAKITHVLDGVPFSGNRTVYFHREDG